MSVIKITKPPEAIAAIKARITTGKLTRYAIAKHADIDRATLRNILDRQNDLQLSNLLSIIHAMGGEVMIRWKAP